MTTRPPLDVLADPSAPEPEALPHPCFGECLSRRGFVSATTAALIAAALAAWGGGGGDPVSPGGGGGGGGGGRPGALPAGVAINGNTITIDLGLQPGLTATNGFLFAPTPARIVVVNVGSNSYRAFSSVCPHEQNDVSLFEGNRLICPTHGSQFTTDGRVVVGPAAGGLTSLAVTLAGTTLTITK